MLTFTGWGCGTIGPCTVVQTFYSSIGCQYVS